MDLRRVVGQAVKFGVVGVVATVIDFGLLIALTELAHLDPLVSAAISFVVSLVFNYLASMRYVFRHRADLSRAKEFAIFVVLSCVGLALNELLMGACIGLWAVNYVAAKVVATVVVMAWNFVSRKIWLDAPDGGYELPPDEAALVDEFEEGGRR